MSPRRAYNEHPKPSGVMQKRRVTGVPPRKEIEIPRLFQLIVDCGDEDRQRRLYERLSAEGWKIRLMNL